MGHLVGELALVQRVRTLDDDWGKFLIPGADIFLFGFGLSDVGYPTHSLDIAMALLFLDEMSFGEVFCVGFVRYGYL